MKFINSTEIQPVFKQLMNEYDKYSWAVAWAGANFDLTDMLFNNSGKIKRMIIGIHFYQTHPDFIERFYKKKNIKFIMKPSGIFHPKLYLFENDKSEWAVIIGSHNFTNSAFSSNSEASVLITSEDKGSEEIKNDIDEYLNTLWKQAVKLKQGDVIDYKELYRKQKPAIVSVSSKVKSAKSSGKLSLDIINMDWDEYFYKVKENELEPRVRLLDKANSLFKQYATYREMTENERKGIAGIYNNSFEEDGYHWFAFGRMSGNGYFHQAIKDNNKYVSDALDEIPMNGMVDSSNYKKFLKIFKKALPEQNNPIGTATRLLAMKRPDYFICFNDANKDNLTEAFEVKKSINIEQYWDLIIARILESNWWNDESTKKGMESSVFNYRTAFLDNLYFDYFQ